MHSDVVVVAGESADFQHEQVGFDSVPSLHIIYCCLEVLVGRVRVDLRGRDARVPECFLHHSQVGHAKQSGCERVPEHVGRQRNAGGVVPDTLDRALNGSRGKRCAVRVQGGDVVCRGHARTDFEGAPRLNDGVGEHFGRRNDAAAVELGGVLVEFYRLFGLVIPDEIAPRELDHFADAESCLQHEVKAQGVRVAFLAHGDANDVDLVLVDGAWHGAVFLRF